MYWRSVKVDGGHADLAFASLQIACTAGAKMESFAVVR